MQGPGLEAVYTAQEAHRMTAPTTTPLPVTGGDIADFMGRSTDLPLVQLAGEHVAVISEMVNAYVRGNGPTRTGLGLGELAFPADLRAVVITATARMVNNPAQLESETADGYASRGSFTSFSLAEQAILHRYRRRAA
jgi:hypothetical protein